MDLVPSSCMQPKITEKSFMIEAHLAAKTTCACALFESSSDLCRALVMINSLNAQPKSEGMECYVILHLISTLFMRRSRITPFTYSAAAFGSRCIKIVFKQVSTMVRTRPQLSLLTVSIPCYQSVPSNRDPDLFHPCNPSYRTCLDSSIEEQHIASCSSINTDSKPVMKLQDVTKQNKIAGPFRILA